MAPWIDTKDESAQHPLYGFLKAVVDEEPILGKTSSPADSPGSNTQRATDPSRLLCSIPCEIFWIIDL
jgi:hypothetical protein